MKDSLVLDALEISRGAFTDGPHSLEIAAGELVSLVGPNGCGKSTLIETVAGLHPARGGLVRFGEQIWSQGQRTIVPPHQRGIGLLLQGLGLWPHCTVRRQVTLVAGGESESWLRLATELQIDAKLDVPPDRLSGGEAQRAALLRALAADPPVLLLDEPTSAQFEASAEVVREVIEAEVARGKRAMIATHQAWPGARRYEW